MIELITIQNFKSIKTFSFHLKNLNVIMGLNGMGKSTFIQSLLLMRQSDNLKDREIRLNGQYISIGTAKDALYQYSKDEKLTFSFKCSNQSETVINCSYIPDADSFKIEEIDIKSDFFTTSLFNSNFKYLNANRLEPSPIYSKSYSNVVSNENVGIKGEYVTHFIEVFGDQDITFDNLLHKDSIVVDTSTNREYKNKSLLNQINLWMGEISPGINIRTTSIQNSEYLLLEYVYQQPNYGTTNRYKPGNVGFGITYALPVVTALLASKPNDLIIIENPESHVHPRGQAELGKLIALAAMNDVQIIVETHSDHILNGIRVATKENFELSDREVLFYFEKDITESEQYSKITNISIDKFGELSEYPEHLIDEWSTQLLKLV